MGVLSEYPEIQWRPSGGPPLSNIRKFMDGLPPSLCLLVVVSCPPLLCGGGQALHGRSSHPGWGVLVGGLRSFLNIRKFDRSPTQEFVSLWGGRAVAPGGSAGVRCILTLMSCVGSRLCL